MLIVKDENLDEEAVGIEIWEMVDVCINELELLLFCVFRI